MENQNSTVLGGLLGRIGTLVGGVSGGAIASDHAAIAQGALVALAGIAIDLAIRWVRQRLSGN